MVSMSEIAAVIQSLDSRTQDSAARLPFIESLGERVSLLSRFPCGLSVRAAQFFNFPGPLVIEPSLKSLIVFEQSARVAVDGRTPLLLFFPGCY